MHFAFSKISTKHFRFFIECIICIKISKRGSKHRLSQPYLLKKYFGNQLSITYCQQISPRLLLRIRISNPLFLGVNHSSRSLWPLLEFSRFVLVCYIKMLQQRELACSCKASLWYIFSKIQKLFNPPILLIDT